jgi:hypothetical protein
MDWKWKIYISFRESIVNTWFSPLIIKEEDLFVNKKNDTSKKFDCQVASPRNSQFLLQVSIDLHMFSSNALHNLIGANFRTLVFAGFRTRRLVWNHLEIRIKTKISLSIITSLVLAVTTLVICKHYHIHNFIYWYKKICNTESARDPKPIPGEPHV